MAAVQFVIAAAAEQTIIPLTLTLGQRAFIRVITLCHAVIGTLLTAEQSVIAGIAIQGIVPCDAQKHIVAIAAMQLVITRPTHQCIERPAAIYDVIARTALNNVDSRTAMNDIVPAASVDEIVTAPQMICITSRAIHVKELVAILRTVKSRHNFSSFTILCGFSYF